jgi:hypothetical protein
MEKRTKKNYSPIKEYTKILFFTVFVFFGLSIQAQAKTQKDKKAPVFTSPSKVSIYEGEMIAIDLNATDENEITYSIQGKDADFFNVDSINGIVTFKYPIRYELQSKFKFKAIASDGKNKRKKNITITIININQLPIAKAGNDQRLPSLHPVTLDASNSSDPDGTIVSYAWSQNGTLLSNESIFTKEDFTSGLHTLTLTVTDNEGGISTDSVNILLNDEPLFITRINADEHQTQALTLESIDTDNDNVSYSIDKEDADLFNLDPVNGTVTFKTAPDYDTKSSYSFFATLSDSFSSVTQKIIINIQEVNLPPIANAGADQTLLKDQSVTLDASNSNDPDGTIVSYEWKENDQILSTSSTFSKNDFTLGSHPLILTVTDNEGASNSDSVILNIEAQPVFTSSPLVSVNEGQLQAITLQASDEDSSTIVYSISGVDADYFNIDSYTGVVTFKQAPDYDTKSSYSFIAIASDYTYETMQSVTVQILNTNQSPVADAGSDQNVTQGQAVTLDASNSYDSDGSIVSYEWRVNGELLSTQVSFTKSDFIVGTHTITLTVTDEEGASGSDSVNVVVNEIFNNNFYLTLLSQYNTDGFAREIELSKDGTKAYIADGQAGIKIINISDPLNPVLIGTYQTNDYVRDLVLSEDETKIYLADRNNELRIIDITNLSQPILLSIYNISYQGHSLVLSKDETKAYIAVGTEGVEIVDISNPLNPNFISKFNTNDYAYDLVLSEDETKIYVANGETGIVILDSSNVFSLQLINSNDYSQNSGLAVGIVLSKDGRRIYLSDNDAGVQVIDVSNPIQLSLIDNYPTESDESRNIVLSNDETVIFIVNHRKGLKVYNIVDVNNPIFIDEYGKDLNCYAMDITLSADNTKAYFIDSISGLHILNLNKY